MTIKFLMIVAMFPIIGCSSGIQKQLKAASAWNATLSNELEEEHNARIGAEDRIKVWSKSFDAATMELKETHAQAGMYELSLEILRQNYICKPNKGYTPTKDDLEDFPIPITTKR
jgi:hypothetical protein